MEKGNRRLNMVAFALVAALGLGYGFWVLYVRDAIPNFKSEYTVKVVAPQVANLAPGARVTSAGVQVGRVTEITRQGIGAIVSLRIDDDEVSPLPRDTLMSLRQRTPVGESYVQITPGKSKSVVRSGAVLPLKQPDDFVELDQVLSVLQGPTRERAQKLIQSLGGAVDGRGPELNDLVGGLNGTLQSLSTLAHVGGKDRTQVKDLVASTGRIMSAIGERQGAIANVANRGLVTMNALASRDEQLSSLLRVLPSTLRQVRTTANTLGDVTTKATPVVANLAGAVSDLKPTMRNLRPAAQEGREVVRELGKTITPLKGTLSRARTLSPAAVKALPQLKSTLCQANPILRYVERYKADLANALGNMQSATNSYDAIGHLARVSVIAGENNVAGLPPSLSTSLASLFHTGILSSMQGLTLDPYPQPGAMGSRGLPDKRALTAEELGKSDYKFERVEADC